MVTDGQDFDEELCAFRDSPPGCAIEIIAQGIEIEGATPANRQVDTYNAAGRVSIGRLIDGSQDLADKLVLVHGHLASGRNARSSATADV